jgi:hypothetical protein
MNGKMKKMILMLMGVLLIVSGIAQPVPAGDENIPYLMTFGPKAGTSWGDDDFSQTFFFLIPKKITQAIYIRVYDPDIGGQCDEINGIWDTKMTYSVFGGKECYSSKDAQETQPRGNYKSGNLLATKSFGNQVNYDMYLKLFVTAWRVMTETFTGIT